MSQGISQNNKRIAKNTLLLYFRTIFIMFISLYTSRVILKQLGINDYGIYNVIGGMVAMFAVISSALSSSISRFITYELGKGNKERLQSIFSISVNIQVIISIVIVILGEIIGIWFLNNKMTIPYERLNAANWVLHCSLITFCINLISIPYNAIIIAHERMSAFAYISILEASMKLIICYILIISPWDRLIFYSLLMVFVSIIVRLAYSIYCNIHFPESRYLWTNDKQLTKEMTSFAGWNFFTNIAYILNTQGISLLINVFFGVTLNAARGIASQVENAIMQFVNNFTTAINPQITKSYALGETDQMFTLICRGAKFSYLLLLFFALPIIIETEYILKLWLNNVPELTTVFVRLTLIGAMINVLGNSSYTACMATGNIKRYVFWITLVGFLVFPLTWIFYKLGYPVESTYYIYIFVYLAVNTVRLYIMKGLLGFSIMRFIKDVILPIFITTIISSILPIIIGSNTESCFARFVFVSLACVISVITSTFYIVLNKNERNIIVDKVIFKLRKNVAKKQA